MLSNRGRRARRWLRWRNLVLVLGVCALLLLVYGWPTHYIVNPPIDEVTRDDGHRLGRYRVIHDADELLLVLSFSGGGSRAAAFSYGALEALRDTVITTGGEPRRLLDEVDIISSVSGGSFTAAYYGLHGERIFDDFERRFLRVPVQDQLIRLLWSPYELIRLSSLRFGRGDLMAEYLDRQLFDGHTFDDMRPDGPYVVINASDIGTSSRFSFTQHSFDLLCSDLTDYPVSRAVTASAAVPAIISAITLRNYAGRCARTAPAWQSEALAKRETTERKYHEAVRLNSYSDPQARPFIHLLDGGLSDNLGVRPLLDLVGTRESVWRAIRTLGGSKVRKIAIIVVNAQREPDTSINRVELSPGTYVALRSAGSVPLDRYTFETLSLLREQLEDWELQVGEARCKELQLRYELDPSEENEAAHHACDEFSHYLIELDFDRVVDAEERKRLKSLSTSFNLEPDQLESLKSAARSLLHGSEQFQRLLSDLQGRERTPQLGHIETIKGVGTDF